LKYSTDEAIAEILQRRERIVVRRRRRTCRVLSGAAGTLLLTLVLAIRLIPERTAVFSAESVYGSFLLSQEAGGYVLASVIAFVLGAAAAWLALRSRRNGKTASNTEDINNEEEAT